MSDVFISYKREERDRAEALHALLLDLHVSSWFDARLPIGEAWEPRLEKQLRDAKAIVVCWSHAAAQSPYVRKEAEIACERSIIAPVRFDSVELPQPFNSFQIADLTNWSGNEDHPELLKMLQRIEVLLGQRNIARNAKLRAGGQQPILVDALRALLVDLARAKGPPLTYTAAQRELKRHADQQGLLISEFDQHALWGALDAITDQNRSRREPPLAVQVVSATTGRPGKGYWQKHVFLKGRGNDLERLVFERHLADVRNYDWPQDQTG